MATTTNPFAGVQIAFGPPAAAPVASEKQVNYLLSLIETRTEDGEQTIGQALEASGHTAQEFIDAIPTRQLVSDTIGRFQALPKLRGSSPKGEPPEGFHFAEGRVYKVQRSQTGNLYAKVLEPGEHGSKKGHFEYVGRAPFKFLSVETLLTLEKAQECDHLYGICCVCGATLTDETSIERGIGPICATKF